MAQPDETTAFAKAILEFRLARSDAFPAEMFGEMGWEYLLVLFIADADGRRLTGRQVAEHLDSRETVAERWLKYLSQQGFVIGDGDGNLDDELTLSAQALGRMESLLDHAKALRAALLPN